MGSVRKYGATATKPIIIAVLDAFFDTDHRNLQSSIVSICSLDCFISSPEPKAHKDGSRVGVRPSVSASMRVSVNTSIKHRELLPIII